MGVTACFTVNFHIVTMEHHFRLRVCRILFHWTNYFRCLCRLPINGHAQIRVVVSVHVSSFLCRLLYMYIYVLCSVHYTPCTVLYALGFFVPERGVGTRPFNFFPGARFFFQLRVSAWTAARVKFDTGFGVGVVNASRLNRPPPNQEP